MKSYKIVSAINLINLEREVNLAMIDGYIPVGAPFMIAGLYHQAMYLNP